MPKPYRLSLKEPNTRDQQAIRTSGKDVADPYADGGPLQASIRGDLDQLFPHFSAMLARCGATKNSAFVGFKTFFKENKIALLHHFAPSRSDLAAYSQLLYAVCLSVVRDAFIDYQHMSGAFFEHVAYGTFLLYTLYKTNPLPPPPKGETLQEQLEMLPLNLYDRRNPKELVYARHYLAPIRIDLEHYGYLLKLMELGKAAMACQEEAPALVFDLLSIVRRLVSTDMLEFCAYTGPCSLEGLAGHELYDTEPTAALGTQVSAAVASSTTNASTVMSSALEDQLKHYQASLKDIRLPPVTASMSNRSKRIRSSLEPLFSNDFSFETLLKAKPAKRQRHVTFGPVTLKCMDDNRSSYEGGVSEILLPDGTSEAQAESIRSAIRTLTDRGESLLLPPKELIAEASQSFASSTSSFTIKGTIGDATSDLESNAGRHALNDLIGRSKRSQYGTNFLATQAGIDNGDNPEDVTDNLPSEFAVMSDLSSDEEDDGDVSVAVSRVGQSALKELLKAASQGKSQKGKRSANKSSKVLTRKRRRQQFKTSDSSIHSSENGAGRRLIGDLLNRVNAKESIHEEESFDGSVTSNHHKNRSSVCATSAQPDSVANQSAQTKETSSYRSNIGGNALRRLLENARTFRTEDDCRSPPASAIDLSNPVSVPAMESLQHTNSYRQSQSKRRRQPSRRGQRQKTMQKPGLELFVEGIDSKRREEHVNDASKKSIVANDNASIRSDVGRNALHGLLHQARRQSGTQQRPRKRVRAQTPEIVTDGDRQDNLVASLKTGEPDREDDQTSQMMDLSQSTMDGETDSVSATSAVGRCALDKLLGRVRDAESESN